MHVVYMTRILMSFIYVCLLKLKSLCSIRHQFIGVFISKIHRIVKSKLC